MKIITRTILFLGISFSGVFGQTYNYLPFMQLDNKIGVSLEEQIVKNSELVFPLYKGKPIKSILREGERLKKVYQPCKLGVCGLNILKNKYYKEGQNIYFGGNKYNVFMSKEGEEIESLFLIRKIKRKEYGLVKNQNGTLFSFFKNKTNLISEPGNTRYVLETCFDGVGYLSSGKYRKVWEMNRDCDNLFYKRSKEENFIIEKIDDKITFGIRTNTMCVSQYRFDAL